jgi:hypothetical protein
MHLPERKQRTHTRNIAELELGQIENDGRDATSDEVRGVWQVPGSEHVQLASESDDQEWWL